MDRVLCLIWVLFQKQSGFFKYFSRIFLHFVVILMIFIVIHNTNTPPSLTNFAKKGGRETKDQLGVALRPVLMTFMFQIKILMREGGLHYLLCHYFLGQK